MTDFHMAKPYYFDENVTLHHGDALAVLASLDGGGIDGVVTDPPYSSGGMMRGDRTRNSTIKYVGSDQRRNGTGGGAYPSFSGDNRDQRGYGYWSALWLSEALRVTAEGGVCVLFSDWRQLPTTTDALQAGGWVWRGIVPWVKPDARPMSGRYTGACEYVVWGSSGDMAVDFSADTLPGFYQARAPRNRVHTAQKPLEVMRGLLQIVPRGGVVLDPFMGSGTTGIAAVLEGRRFIGIENHRHHVQEAERRIREAQGQAVPRGEQLAIGEEVTP